MVRRQLTLLGLGGMLLLTMLFAGTQANADVVQFRYNGGSWSHSRRAGWHRYWGGPSIGFYYSSAPVYVVRGYEHPRYYSYYSGPDYWYSEPRFGLSINIGGGGHYRDSGYRDHYYTSRDRYYIDRDRSYRTYPRSGGYTYSGGRDHGRSDYRVSDHSSYGGRNRDGYGDHRSGRYRR